MTSLPSGLASISSRLDDSPQVRGAVDMAMRLRRADALSALAEMDAPLIDVERPADVERAVAFGRMVRREEERRKNEMFRAIVDSLPSPPPTTLAERVERCDRRAAMMSLLRCERDPASPDLTSAIDRHAALAIGSCYKSADKRA